MLEKVSVDLAGDLLSPWMAQGLPTRRWDLPCFLHRQAFGSIVVGGQGIWCQFGQTWRVQTGLDEMQVLKLRQRDEPEVQTIGRRVTYKTRFI